MAPPAPWFPKPHSHRLGAATMPEVSNVWEPWSSREPLTKHKIDKNLRVSERNVQLRFPQNARMLNAQVFLVFMIVIGYHRLLDKALKYYMQFGQKQKFQLHSHQGHCGTWGWSAFLSWRQQQPPLSHRQHHTLEITMSHHVIENRLRS